MEIISGMTCVSQTSPQVTNSLKLLESSPTKGEK